MPPLPPSIRESSGLRLGLAAIILWATITPAALWIGRQLGVWQYLALGNLIGFVGQVALYRLLGRSPRTLLVLPGRLWAAVALGFVLYACVYTLGLLAASTDGQAVGVGLMNYLWPLAMVLFAVWLVPGSRMSARLGLAMALSVLGLAVANGRDIIHASGTGAGIPYALGLVAALSFGLYSALIARWRDWAQRYATAPAGFLMTGLLAAVACLVTGQWHPIGALTWAAIVYVGLVPNAAGYLLWELAIHRAPATKLGLLASATPVLATLCLLGLFALSGKSEALPANWQALLAGAGMIAAAVLLVSVPVSAHGPRSTKRPAARPTQRQAVAVR